MKRHGHANQTYCSLRKSYEVCGREKIKFQEALIKEVGQRQAPAMQWFFFQKLVQRIFEEYTSYAEPIEPYNLHGLLCQWSLGGSLYWLPSVLNVPIINDFSQRTRYELITDNSDSSDSSDSGGGDGGGDTSGDGDSGDSGDSGDDGVGGDGGGG